MKPTAIFNGMIADMREQGHTIDYELAERNTRAALRDQSVEEEEASRLVDGFQPNVEDPFFVGWPITEEDCPYAGLGTKCEPLCVYCDMKHVCMDCTLQSRSVEATIDPPCPLRIPGCRCSSGAGPEPFEYYCSTGDPFMGAYAQQGAGDKEIREGELEDEVHFDAETRKEDVIEVENDGDESLEDCESKRSFEEIGDKEPLNDENEGEEYFEDETCNLSSPQSLWPLSPAFWQGLVPGWEQSLPPSSQPVNYNNYSDFLSEPPTSRPECSVAIGPHAHGGRPDASRGYDLLESSTPRNQNPTVGIQCRYAEELPTSSTFGKYLVANNGYSLFVPGSPGLANQGSEAGNQNSSAGKTTSSKKPAARESRPQASHEQEAFHKRAAVGEVRSSQQPTPKKDSRGWGEHEKAFVKILMEEVIAEGEHDRTEERWKVISRRLSSRYSVNRTWTAVKNMWNRHGRNDFNIDERKVKKPDRMITGVQDPESRRKARSLKRKDAESEKGNGLVDLDYYDDSDLAPSSKRQRV